MITWLVSYPRSGNTYVRTILNSVFGIKSYSIHGDYLDIAENREISGVVGHVDSESLDLSQLRDGEEVFYIKTHKLPDSEDFNFEKDRFIYVTRDGRDASLSYCHYLNDIAKEDVNLSDVILGNVSFGSWGEHVRSWSLFSKSGNFLLLKFEDLLDNFDDSLRDINYFLFRNSDELTKIKEVPPFSDLNSKYPNFFRNGKKASWKSSFSQQERQVFEVLNRTELLAMSYECESYDVAQLVEYHGALNSQNLSVELLKVKQLGFRQLTMLQNSYKELQEHNQSLQEHNQSLQEDNLALQQLYQSILLQRDVVLGSIRFKIGSLFLLPIDILNNIRSHFKR
ncbi:hypothetical protein RN22_06355 [Grimontia sp. AD028]|uniref:sulfotransferase domain-containing protein n=1 Tax=Grimontia sp. AD028 TaxID=1581149 RepID=UPI00061AE87B|nr:sulfotransferase domain-containing protein [Grimontia sp. AD028]KKD61337.1 hypothetical protein RN22_06355 [Grimontia sp. AD028]